MKPALVIRNRQRVRKVDLRLLRRIVKSLLSESLQIESYELGIRLVAAPEMAQVNKTYLHHEGSTDVITFDHSVGQASRLSQTSKETSPKTDGDRRDACPALHGELFICLDDAIVQAREFKTTWQSEVVRYVIHGILHLVGHDDHRAADRRKMKCEENRLLREIARRFALSKL